MSRLTNVSSGRSRRSIGDWVADNARDFAWMAFMIGIVFLFAYLKQSSHPIP